MRDGTLEAPQYYGMDCYGMDCYGMDCYGMDYGGMGCYGTDTMGGTPFAHVFLSSEPTKSWSCEGGRVCRQ